MGPGSFDPGNMNWGMKEGKHNVPSMGPGSFDPGNDIIAEKFGLNMIPSMGPGSFDPGNEGYRLDDGGVFGAFNGAGVFRPRKCRATRTKERLK